jgi:hypothetical protein
VLANIQLMEDTTMKHLTVFLFAVALFITGTVWADTHGGSMHDKQTESQMMSTQEATHEMMHQTMSQKSMQNMMQMMEEMRNNMMQMSQMMEKHKMMSQMQLSEAAKMMDHMSTSMHEMSKQMHEGKFDDKTVAMMKERNKEMHAMIEKLQKQMEAEKK